MKRTLHTLAALSLCLLAGCLRDPGTSQKVPLGPATAWQLTFDTGNDTEAAWSPDGRTIAFQTDRTGDMDICLLDVETGKIRTLVAGPGDACFPAWAPDGKSLVYSYAHLQGSAEQERNGNGWNLFRIEIPNGTPRRLTSGRHRDLTPTFTPDGERIVFASSRGWDKKRRVQLYSIPADGGEPTLFHGPHQGRDSTWMQPSFSPDGTHFAVGYVRELRDNWAIHTGFTASPAENRPVTPLWKGALYGPRWAPIRNGLIACTGFDADNPTWGVYLLEAYGTKALRVSILSGNSRSPAWSPDGKSLVFENNSTGTYKLYRMGVTSLSPPTIENDPLARIPTITASNHPDVAKNAFDGDLDDQSNWFCVGLDQWIEARYKAPMKIRGFRVHSGVLAYAKNPSGTQSVAGYKLQAWVAGKWQDLVEPVSGLPKYAGQTRESFYTEHTFAPVTTDRIRFVLTASHDTLCRMRSPNKPCVKPEDAATYIREIEVLPGK